MKLIFGTIAVLLTVFSTPDAAHGVPSLGIGQSDGNAAAGSADSTAVISITEPSGTDDAIDARLRNIYRELDGLEQTKVAVDAGVVTLSGSVAEPDDIDRARQIALRVDGVVAVQNNLRRDGNVSENLAPVVNRLNERIQQVVQMAPLFAIAMFIILVFVVIGSGLARAKSLWARVSPNSFLADLIATTVRLVVTLIGIVIALDLLGATTLLGAILGSAGVIGLAIGFAVKDTIDNYVSSIMLSIRQPFRANDLVVIGEHEGRVIRLNSRATILMTLDGNHLRIPNNMVFKAVILNYTRNPERRFDFVLGIDAADDPGDAITQGTHCMRALPFVLNDPAPGGRLEEVGDSSIIVRFVGWINQTETDWFKARSAAIRAVKMTLEEHGFGLPEPIYRVRFDSGSPLQITGSQAEAGATTQKPQRRADPPLGHSSDHSDVSVGTDIEEKVKEERDNSTAEDMLDNARPVE